MLFPLYSIEYEVNQTKSHDFFNESAVWEKKDCENRL